MKLTKKGKLIFLAILFLAAFLERTVFDLGPNVELVTTVMLLSAFYFGQKESFWLTFAIMFLSDLIIGNSTIFIFTWSGFLIPALVAGKILKKSRTSKTVNALSLTGGGISSNIFFYLWTNFGVWLMGSMYPKTPAGLLLSYVNGLPFMKYQVVSTLVFVPLLYFATELLLSSVKNLHLKTSFLFRKLTF